MTVVFLRVSLRFMEQPHCASDGKDDPVHRLREYSFDLSSRRQVVLNFELVGECSPDFVTMVY